jgi:hypothetical protein
MPCPAAVGLLAAVVVGFELVAAFTPKTDEMSSFEGEREGV